MEIPSFSKSILRLDIIDSKSSLFYNENMTPPIANNVLSALPSVTLVTFLINHQQGKSILKVHLNNYTKINLNSQSKSLR